jgi:hypothetical protein
MLLPGQSAKTYEGEGTVTAIPSSQSMTSAAQSTPTPNNQAAETNPAPSLANSYSNSLPSSTSSALWPSNTNNLPNVAAGSDLNNSHGWGDMAGGDHIALIVSIIIGVVLIVIFSFWFCCGGRAWWSRRHDETNSNSLPLYTIRGRNTQAGVHREAGGGGDAPPIYAEVAPPEHQTVAGGMRDANEVQRLEEEAAVVSDGKTPLSEIAFEDVVLERHVSESESSGSSSRGFDLRHHAMGGDTTGRTNT